MKSLFFLAVAAGLISFNVLADNSDLVQVIVLKNNVNLRAKPTTKSEIVGQVSENDLLMAKSITDEWVQIAIPDSVTVWILGDYVQEAVVTAQKVNVRAGPGINFSIVGQVNQGMNVTIRERHDVWIGIAPPASSSVWINKSLVKVIEEEKIALDEQIEALVMQEAKLEKPAVLAQAKDIIQQEESVREDMRKVKAVKPPSDLDLIPSKGQGQWRQYEGIIRQKAYLFRNPSRYRLVVYDSNHNAKTICHIRGNRAQLKALLNRHVIISGREYFVRRSDYPVLVPERIVLK